MNRLPLPNWSNSPNLNPDGSFSAFLNIGYRSFPFMGQQYRSIPTHNIALRPPFLASRNERGAQCQEQINMAPHKALPQKPEDFSCDVCERSFKRQQILQTHLQSHVKCDYKDCSFSASRKMLKLHFIQNHAKGRMRIKLDTPEEIEKWREQRRKRYPTLANIQKKLAEEKARRESGQIAATETFRYQGKRHQRRQNNRRFNRQRNSKYQDPVRRRPENQQSETQILCENEVGHCTVEKQETKSPSGDPLSFLLVNSNNNSDDEQKREDLKAMYTQTSGSVSTSALVALCSYGGDSSSDDSDTEKEINNNNQAMNPIKTNNSDQRLSNEVKSVLPSTQRATRKRKQGLKKNKNSKSRKVTLLEKLLAPEIRHEHNIILQCIRYIVKNDYFDEQ